MSYINYFSHYLSLNIKKINYSVVIKKLRQWLDLEKEFWIFWLLFAVFFIGCLLRFYRVDQTFLFLGDQGRDAMIVAKVFLENDLMFIGPTTSVGQLYLGPLYYYFMLPFLWLSYPSPVGPVLAVAFFNFLSVIALYKLSRHLFNLKVSIFATSLYAFSALMVEYSRFSWNPNISAPVMIILIFALFKAFSGKMRYWSLVFLIFAFLLQLHYLMLVLIASIGFLWLWQFASMLKVKNSYQSLKSQLYYSLLGFLGFIALYVPIILFDIKNNFLNANGFYAMFFGSDHFNAQKESLLFRAISVLQETHGRSLHVFLETLIGGDFRSLNTIILLLSIIVFVVGVYKNFSNKKIIAGLMVVFSILFFSILGISAYEHSIFDHYIIYLMPAVVIYFGFVADQIIAWSKPLGWLAVVLFFGLFLRHNFLSYKFEIPEWGAKQMQLVAETILERVDESDRYDIVLLSETGDLYGQSYRYFLTTHPDKKPIDPQIDVTSDVLFIIDEQKLLSIDDLLAQPIYQIEIFPQKEVSEIYYIENVLKETTIYGPRVIVLRK